MVCDKNYYPDNEGKCVRVTAVISNCEVYITNNQCKKCSSLYALSSDGSSCTGKREFDSNC